MATNTNKGSRKGAVKKRSQTINNKTGLYVKRDTSNGQFVRVKKDGTPFKGVRKEEPVIKITQETTVTTKKKVVTKIEIYKMAPALKKLADYDKGKKK
jgi:hypothetical protein